MTQGSESRVLDLFCCEGGSAAGYMRAGFAVYGVDIEGKFSRRYPGDGFLQGDCLEKLEILANGGRLTFGLRGGSITLGAGDFDLIHASPPCQAYTRGNAGKETKWPKLIPEVRDYLKRSDTPYVIENVEGARPELVSPVGLCGCMFNLGAMDSDGVQLNLRRLRLFEASWGLSAPRPCDHSGQDWVAGVYGGARRDKYEAKFIRKGGYVPPDKSVAKALLGVDWDMTWNGLYQSIPPAYTEWVGKQLCGLERV